MTNTVFNREPDVEYIMTTLPWLWRHYFICTIIILVIIVGIMWVIEKLMAIENSPVIGKCYSCEQDVIKIDACFVGLSADKPQKLFHIKCWHKVLWGASWKDRFKRMNSK